VLTFPPFISGSELTKSDTLGDITLLIVSSSGQTAASTGGMDIDLQVLSHHRLHYLPLFSHQLFRCNGTVAGEEDLSLPDKKVVAFNRIACGADLCKNSKEIDK